MTQPARLLLVGYGQVARKHLTAIHALGARAALVGVCEPAPQAAQQARERAHTPVFSALDDALSATRPDLVILTSPSGLHPAQAIEAMAHGAHVLSEKPLALTLDDARAMIAASRAHKRRLFVVRQMRLWPALIALKRALDSGELGAPRAIDARVLWARPQPYFDAAPWRGTLSLDGGTLLNQANHYVDLITWLMGLPQTVSAHVATLGRDIEADDSAALWMRWPQALGTMQVSVLAHPESFDASLTLVTARATIRLGGPGCDQVLAWRAQGAPDLDALTRATQAARIAGHALVYPRVLDALARGLPDPDLDADDLAAPTLLHAAQRSHHAGRAIALDLGA